MLKRHLHDNSLISRENPHNLFLQMPIPEINLDLGATVQLFAPCSANSAPNKDKYPVDDIKDPTHCTLIYLKAGHQGLSKLSKIL
jgi:hypothetical protein